MSVSFNNFDCKKSEYGPNSLLCVLSVLLFFVE